MKDILIKILIIIGTLTAVFTLGRCSSQWSHEAKPECDTITVEKHDTIVDTVLIEKPQAVDSAVIGKIVTKTVIQVQHDTVTKDSLIEVELPLETKTYKDDSTYEAQISGYAPKLDYIKVYPRTINNTIEKTIYVKQKEKWYQHFRPSVTAGAGYGLIHKQLDVYVGFGFGYSF